MARGTGFLWVATLDTMRTRSVAVALVAFATLVLAACSTSMSLPQFTGCVSDAEAQKLITRTDATLKQVVCAGSDWAMVTYTYTTSAGKKDEPGEAILTRYDGVWRALVQGISVQELCTPTVKDQLAKAPSPIKELTAKC